MENKNKVCVTVSKGLGAALNPIDERDLHLAQVQAPVSVPMKNITDISMLAVENQKDKGTCVGQGEGKNAEYQEFKENKKVTRLSKRFLYEKCKEIDGLQTAQGTYPRNAAKVLTDIGTPECDFVPDNNDLPYSEYMQFSITPDTLKSAKKYRMKGYAMVFNNIDSIKQALYQNGVVSATLMVGDWGGMPLQPLPQQGLHRILFFGYEEEQRNGLRDLKIWFRNSWGVEWGIQGNGWFYWSDYQNYIFDLMAYVDLPNEVIEDLKNQAYKFTITIKKGSRGEEVTQLEKFMKTKGLYSGAIDGVFGPMLDTAVKAYQKANNLTADGIVGPQTRATINAENGGVVKKKSLVEALIEVESAGNDQAIGDKDLTDHAYGPLQVRKPVCTDVNKALGTTYQAQQCLGNRPLSILLFNAYMDLYATSKALKRPVTDQDRARIWNGGPSGWKRTSTKGYWAKVQKSLENSFTGVPMYLEKKSSIMKKVVQFIKPKK